MTSTIHYNDKGIIIATKLNNPSRKSIMSIDIGQAFLN